MRYAGMVIKIVSLILISILFILFLLFASSFGAEENMADLAMSNVLVSAMILVLIVSAVASLAFDFYERNKYQNEEIFAALEEKIANLSQLEDKVKEITAEYGEKMAEMQNGLSVEIRENTAKFEECMRQFANLSVMVFSKDKQAQNMEHGEKGKAEAPKISGDYFNHYTKENDDVIEPDEKVEIHELKIEDKVPEPEISEVAEADEKLPDNLIDDILNSQETKKNEDQQVAEAQLSTIFNDELADTLAGLEIMQDEKEEKSEDIDLDKYFSGEEKIKL